MCNLGRLFLYGSINQNDKGLESLLVNEERGANGSYEQIGKQRRCGETAAAVDTAVKTALQ